MKSPPKWKLQKIFKSLGMEVTLHKVTETEINAAGDDEYGDEYGQTSVSEETYTIYAEVQSITLEDMAFLPAGEVKEGDAWGYFLSSYFIEGEDITVDVNDYITFKGNKYLVTRIEDYYAGSDTVYRRALLKREVGQS